MEFRKSAFFRSLTESYRVFWQSRLLVILPCIADFIFFIVFGFIYSFIAVRMLDHLYEATQMLGDRISSLQIGGAEQQLIVSDQALLESHISSAVALFVLITIVFYFLWNIFQGYSWKITHKIVDRNVPLLEFLRKFSLVNMIFFLGAGAIILILLQVSFASAESLFSNMREKIISVIIMFVFAFMAYFVSLSYALIARHKILAAVAEGFKRGARLKEVFMLFITFIALLFIITYLQSFIALLLGLAALLAIALLLRCMLVPAFIVILLKLYIAYNIISVAVIWSTLLAFVAGVVLVLPLMAWSRIFLILLVEKSEKKN